MAVPLSQTEKLAWERRRPDELGDLLVEPAALVQRARDRGQRLYCWWSL